MRTVKLTKESTKDILENLLKRMKGTQPFLLIQKNLTKLM